MTFLQSDKMKSKKYWITVVVLLAGFHPYFDRCTATEAKYFYSEGNGYSMSIPDGWTQVPDDILRQALDKSPSGEAKQRLLSQYEVVFQHEAAGRRLQYPYVVVEVINYSEDGLNGQPNEDDFDYLAKDMARKLSGVLDKNNRIYKFDLEMEVANLGKVKTQTVGHFGRYATVQLMFSDLNSHWSQSKADRDLIFGSFQFIPAVAYNEAAARPARPGFLERRAMEALPGIVLVLIVVGISVICGLIAGIAKRRKRNQLEDNPENSEN